ncbi:hypothetical protein AMTR_s00050p00022420 [Amborella trichopoda]|uniref:Uncharacterized protein n=1 Tax=Amborella trichopoda TaxID=13333 RepID=W1PXV8_AMBTC|nr:hypothetical protein AMTR_s00050p00022420 [Amborella trichopoda]
MHGACGVRHQEQLQDLISMQLTNVGELPHVALMVGEPKRREHKVMVPSEVGTTKRGDSKDMIPQRRLPHRREVGHEARMEPRAKASALGRVNMAPSKARKSLEWEPRVSKGKPTQFAPRSLGEGGQSKDSRGALRRHPPETTLVVVALVDLAMESRHRGSMMYRPCKRQVRRRAKRVDHSLACLVAV